MLDRYNVDAHDIVINDLQVSKYQYSTCDNYQVINVCLENLFYEYRERYKSLPMMLIYPYLLFF